MRAVESREDELPEEIAFSGAERGRYLSRIAPGATAILLEPDVTEVYPDSAAVNAALRKVIAAGNELVSQRKAS